MRASMKVVLAGGSGTLGQRLANHFERSGHDVAVLTRAPRSDSTHRQIPWDGRTVGPWAAELEGAVLVNLAGRLVDCRPTRSNIAELTSSRVEPTKALVAASADLTTPPVLWIQMSTLAIYGDGGEGVIEEGHSEADQAPQMTGVARAWENAFHGAAADRLVVLRTGIVLDRGTPALDRLTHLTRFGLGGRISSGRQWISWIHIDDYLHVIDWILEHPDVDGTLHVTAPNPVRNRDLMAELRTAFHRPWSPPTPRPLVHVGAVFMRTDPALALTGRRCIPRRLLDDGFTFTYPSFKEALADLLQKKEP